MGVQVRSPLQRCSGKNGGRAASDGEEGAWTSPLLCLPHPPKPPPRSPGRLACVCSCFHFLPGRGAVITGNLKDGPLGVSLRTHHPQMV